MAKAPQERKRCAEPFSPGYDKEKRTRLIFDIETDGLLDEMTKVHSVHIIDDATGDLYSALSEENRKNYVAPKGVTIISIEAALEMLADASEIVGHNIQKFDIPAIQLVYPDWKPQGLIKDTLILSKMLCLNHDDIGYKLMREGRIPGRLATSHSLEAWGYRVGMNKGEYKDLPMHAYRAAEEAGLLLSYHPKDKEAFVTDGNQEWSSRAQKNETQEDTQVRVARQAFKDLGIQERPFEMWCPEMQEYGDQDARVTWELFKLLSYMRLPLNAYNLELRVTPVIVHMERYGFHFDMDKAKKLEDELIIKRAEVDQKVRAAFSDWYAPEKLDDITGEPVVTVVPKTRRVQVDDDIPNVKVFREERVHKTTGKPLKPKIYRAKALYEQGAEYTRIKRIQFNPGSTQNIYNRLINKYGWKPTKFTPGGQPQVDEDTLKSLTQYPECELLIEYLMLNKRLSSLSEGNKAWTKFAVEENGRWYLRGSYDQLGTNTHRSTHFNPNIGQVTSSEKPYGKECRELFSAPPGWVSLGSDMKSLENFCLASELRKYDKGAYLKVCTNGSLTELLPGADTHWGNAQAMGLVGPAEERDKENPHHKTMRAASKTAGYAILYGQAAPACGEAFCEIVPMTKQEALRLKSEPKHEWIVGYLKRKKIKYSLKKFATIAKGSELIEAFVKGRKGLKEVIAKAEKAYKTRKNDPEGPWIKSIDGRPIALRSAHSALNTRLQSTGAVICKLWMVKVFERILREGYKPGWDGDFVLCAWVHDELQFNARTQEIAERIGLICEEEALKIGPELGFNALTVADYDIGQSWADTH